MSSVTTWKNEFKVSVPEGKKGDWEVKRMVLTEKDVAIENIRSAWKPGSRTIDPGSYTMLNRNGQVIMSDTPSEIADHLGFIYNAEGNVLIAGLGIGVVLQACLRNKKVKAVTVVEKSQDVYDLVAPHYLAMEPVMLQIYVADIFEWNPPKGVHYDHGWFDIWDNICADNLEEMTKLKRKFARKVTHKGCWTEDLCRRYAQEEKRNNWWRS